jgi:hypothetical protein
LGREGNTRKREGRRQGREVISERLVIKPVRMIKLNPKGNR